MLTITYSVDGGGCEIRTHAPVKANGFQDRLVMTTSITLRKYDATACIIFTELLRCGSASFARRIHCRYPHPKIDKLACQAQGVGIFAARRNNSP